MEYPEQPNEPRQSDDLLPDEAPVPPERERSRPTTTAPTRSRSSKASRPCASARRCTSGRPAPRAAPPRLRDRRQLDRRGAGGFCDQVNVTIHIDNSITVVDNGRGIPVDPPAASRRPEVVLTVLHAGGKFDNDSYKVSGGLHGVGVSVVNALSEWLELEIWRNGKVYQQSYERGDPASDLEVTGTTQKRGTKVTFKPDTADLRDDRVQLRHAGAALRELAFLNGGISSPSTTSATARGTSSSTKAASFVRPAPEQEQARSTTSRSS